MGKRRKDVSLVLGGQPEACHNNIAKHRPLTETTYRCYFCGRFSFGEKKFPEFYLPLCAQQVVSGDFS